MSEKISYKLNPGKNTYTFPEQCIVCGSSDTEPLRREFSLAGKQIAQNIATKTYIKHVVELDIPYCHQHRMVAKIVHHSRNLVPLMGLILGGLGAGLVLVALGVESQSFIVISLTVCGIVGSIFMEWLVKAVAAKFIDSAFQNIPMWAYLKNYMLGMKVKVGEDRITFMFDDDQFAEAFRELNRHRWKKTRQHIVFK
jgi:rRNA maturation protein Nop10